MSLLAVWKTSGSCNFCNWVLGGPCWRVNDLWFLWTYSGTSLSWGESFSSGTIGRTKEWFLLVEGRGTEFLLNTLGLRALIAVVALHFAFVFLTHKVADFKRSCSPQSDNSQNSICDQFVCWFPCKAVESSYSWNQQIGGWEAPGPSGEQLLLIRFPDLVR